LFSDCSSDEVPRELRRSLLQICEVFCRRAVVCEQQRVQFDRVNFQRLCAGGPVPSPWVSPQLLFKEHEKDALPHGAASGVPPKQVTRVMAQRWASGNGVTHFGKRHGLGARREAAATRNMAVFFFLATTSLTHRLIFNDAR